MTFSQLRTPLALFGSRSKPRATDPRFQHLADQRPQLILLVSPHADSVIAANANAVPVTAEDFRRLYLEIL